MIDVVARLAGIVPFLSIAFTTQVEALCYAPPFRTLDNQPALARMLVTSGEPCSIQLGHSYGPMHPTEIVRRPAHGTLAVEGAHKVVYRSRPGYVGADTFIYQIRGETTRGVPVVHKIGVAVQVTAK